MPARVDLPIWAGATGDLGLDLGIDPDLHVPFDVRGSTLIWRVMRAGAEILRKTTDGGIEITDEVGRIIIRLSAPETRLMASASARYELEQRVDGIERTLVYGSVVVTDWGGNVDG